MTDKKASKQCASWHVQLERWVLWVDSGGGWLNNNVNVLNAIEVQTLKR